MRNAIQLSADGLIDFRAAMTVEIRPNRGITVEIFVPRVIFQHGALAFDDHDGDMAGRIPVPHLREGMPDVFPVEIGGGHGG